MPCMCRTCSEGALCVHHVHDVCAREGGLISVVGVGQRHARVPPQVAFVTWSPDDQLLLTVSEEVVRLWQVSSGRLLHTFT